MPSEKPQFSPHPSLTFQAPPERFDLPSIELAMLELWQEKGIEEHSLRGERVTSSQESARKDFVFYDGPPFATGLPHYGHLLAGTIKDIVPRFWFMRGYHVERRFGWDCHGLPIESLVEKELNLQGKADIEAFGVPNFNAACRAGVLRFTAEWERIVKRMGRWVDFHNDYKTMDASFMESVWWVFKQLWDKNLIYEGYRVQPVSPALGTPLSNFEVAQGPQERDPVTRKDGHKRRQDPSLTVRFKLEDEDAYLWAWTTTPWTLPSNLALAVHPQVDYVKIRLRQTGEVAYIEASRLADYQARGRIGETEQLAKVRGAELVGRFYQPLLPFFQQYRTHADGRRWAFRVVGADYVTTDSGTGIVHQAPAFGEDDYQVAQREGLPLVNPLNLSGIFDDSVGEFAGMFAKDADKAITERLQKEGKVVDRDTIVHPYPHCYRTDQPLLYMALSTWFMRLDGLQEQLIAHNKEIHWVPEYVGTGRFGNWLENVRDWNLSRNRFWGTPLPIWRCDKNPADLVCIGSIGELEQVAGLAQGSIQDLHREYIDHITWPSKAGGTMRRIPEVFDCWFESGSMPYAQNHYPFGASKKAYVENNLPADFIAEGLDQTRGWFYTLHVLATALFDRPAFRNVIVNGLILAADGKKMSKRLKNYPDPEAVINTFGADALRAYLINSAVVRAEPMRFGKDKDDLTGECVRDTVRTAILPLWNAYNFLVTYARADGWTPTQDALQIRPQGELDRWILSRVQGFVQALTQAYEAYNLSGLIPLYLAICDELNNWYIRRGRRRYWRAKGEGAERERDKHEAYATLYSALVTISQAMAPVLPFFSEYLHQRLIVDVGFAEQGQESVHLLPFPHYDESQRDLALEESIARVRQVVTLAMALREREKVAVRRPLAMLTVCSSQEQTLAALRHFASDICGELNVKQLELSTDDSYLVSLRAKANFKSLGSRLGKRMKEVAQAVQNLNGEELKKFTQTGEIRIADDILRADDIVLIREPKPGQVVMSESDITIVLDTNMNDELLYEGWAREVINRVQNLRKQAELDVSQRIALFVASDESLGQIFAQQGLRELIKSETLSNSLEQVETIPEAQQNERIYQRSDLIDGQRIEIGLRLI